jgi:hypothetical protein
MAGTAVTVNYTLEFALRSGCRATGSSHLYIIHFNLGRVRAQ